MVSAHIHLKASQLTGQHLTMQMDNGLKHTVKAAKVFCFFFTERKMSKGHAETENSYSITKDKTQIQHLMMFVGSRLQVDIVFKGFATKY